MRVLIRVDMGGEHGRGHVTRMRALAHALAEQGVEVLFVTKTPALHAFVAPFPCHDYGGPILYADDICIIDTKDHDSAEDEWCCFLRRTLGTTIVRIDHPTATPDTCDLLIGPGAHWMPETVTRLQADFGERFLYGWDYVMLDESVTSCPPIPYDKRKDGPIVFCAGGRDADGALEQMLWWTATRYLKSECIFCYGELYHGWLRHDYVRETDHDPAVVHFDWAYLQKAALVVTMMGQTVYECLYYHTPVFCFARTPEDADLLAQWERSLIWWKQSGPHIPPLTTGGLFSACTQEHFAGCVGGHWQNPSWRTGMSHAAHGLIDGHGVQRVADAILALGG